MRIEKIIIIKWRKIVVLKAKKIVSLFVGAAMAANVFATMPFTVFANDEIDHTYTYTDYEVTYDVTNSWGNTDDESFKIILCTLTDTNRNRLISDKAIINRLLTILFRIPYRKFLNASNDAHAGDSSTTSPSAAS